ncbi:MAG: glutamate racemase [Paludibacteraceae bacterium]|nr:glutamate racemase [Paludibacteraceae bacterium]
MASKQVIGVFDSGYGGLTILQEIRALLPQYDYVYLGDNARTPYGNRSFEVVYQFTRQAVLKLFEMQCQLVILACNTASAKALRTIQQHDLPALGSDKRVLGIIRPTTEMIGSLTKTRHVGLLGTEGTISSGSYGMETRKLFPDIVLTGQACPMWVPLVENGEAASDGADYFVRQYIDALLQKDPDIDLVVLACTHYPLLYDKIRRYLPGHIQIVNQGPLVAHSLQDYLQRHQEIAQNLGQNGRCAYYTTEQSDKFARSASVFLQRSVQASHLDI